MRTRKALINSVINIVSYIIIFIPNLLIRRVFLTTLGSEMLGLSSLYNNIIGWLSIFELGVGTAIVYSLYRPYAENNKDKMRAYIKFYGQFYRRIGFVILGVGITISPFLSFFITGNVDIRIATIGFLLFLINSFISYIFSHKLCILNVSQQAYKITIGTTISKLVIIALQTVLLNNYPNFILYISIQLFVNLSYFIAINLYIRNNYPWINYGNNKLEEKEKNGLLRNVKAMFMHKIGHLVVNSTDNIVISKFVGLTVLTNYTNYQIIISALQSIISTGLSGITASIGNMLTDDDNSKAYIVHKRIFFLSFWIISFIVISLYNTLNQFIVIWMGKESLLNNLTYILILINLYFTAMRGSVDQFQTGSGNFYQDRYAPICEAIINLISSVILVKYIGIAGVFLGTLISNITVIFWTKPYVVYKYVFKESVGRYFKMYIKYILIGIIPLIITACLTNTIKEEYSFLSFIINCLINIVVINISYFVIFFKSDEFKYYTMLIKQILTNK